MLEEGMSKRMDTRAGVKEIGYQRQFSCRNSMETLTFAHSIRLIMSWLFGSMLRANFRLLTVYSWPQ